ncbi:hypothetical protein FOL47_010291 [Perkinsus chesapeaki]|uniref:N-acetyltransferase domain-containing protein n=1 Tax=Perkinsus chesapeaki TaxID=330153 RepID=A0A7J6L464_PERCH|nr:hypothetical protein FOL47_010291 [Perkinsus chesapeaki]
MSATVAEAQSTTIDSNPNAVIGAPPKRPSFRLVLVDLTDKNIGQVRLLNELTFPVRYGDHFYEGILTYKDNGGFVKLAYMCDVLVGSIACRVMPIDPKDATKGMKMYIMTLSVLPMYRRCGVATTLLKSLEEELLNRRESMRAEREAKARSASHHHGQHNHADEGFTGQVVKISLDVQINNVSAIGFYQKHGFTKVAEVPGYYPDLDPKDAYTMEKQQQLPAAATVVVELPAVRGLSALATARKFTATAGLPSMAAGIVRNPAREREFARRREGEEEFDLEKTKRKSMWMRDIGRYASEERQNMYIDYIHSVKSLRALLDYYDIAVPSEHEIDLKKSAASVGLSLPQGNFIAMKAFVYGSKAGSMEWSQTTSVPKPGRNQVQVKVMAVGVNPIDYKLPTMVPFSSWLLRGRPAGFDFSGKVTVANGDFKEGEMVHGNTMKGALAEYTVADTFRIARVPEGMDYKTAAAMPSTCDTALIALRKAQISETTRNVLIIGASGGVGSSGVQIAKSLGAKVWGICSGKNSEFVKSLGADEVLDYTKPDFAFPNKQCPTDSIDVVFDTVSSPEDMNYEPLVRKSLKKDGVYIATNSPSRLDLARSILSNFLPVNLQRSGYYMVMADCRTHDLETLGGMVTNGELKVPIQEVLPFTEEGCKKAFELVKSRRVKGKIVVDMEK